jgi:hypothetical protein
MQQMVFLNTQKSPRKNLEVPKFKDFEGHQN